MALRDMIVSIVREVASELIEQRFGSEPEVMEIARGPDGSILADHNNQCWLKKVSLSSTDDTSPIIKSDNYATPIQVGLKVLYGSRDGQATKKEVLGLAYFDGGYLSNGEKISSVAKHGHTHGISTAFNSPYQVHAHDAITIGVPNIEPLRTRPSAAGGVAIDVEALEYRYNGTSTVFGGVTNLSLSSAIPGAGLQRFVAVYLDKSTNMISTANGATIAIGAGRPADPTITDTNIILSSYVRLKNGATSISVTDDISDQRDIIGGAVKISNVPYQDADSVGQLTTDDDLAKSANVLFEGDLKIGTAGAAGSALHIQNSAGAVALTIDGNDASDRDIVIESDSTPRWIIQANDTAESGSNAGSDLQIVSYDDAGVVIDDPAIFVRRSNGHVAIGDDQAAASARLTIRGTNSSASDGPNQNLWTDGDAYPQMQFMIYAHDDMAIVFDGYKDSGNDWISCDTGSQFIIHKTSDKLQFNYSNITQGTIISSWSTGLVMDDAGEVGIGTTAPEKLLHVYGGGTLPAPTHFGEGILIQNDANTTDQARLILISGNATSGTIDFGDTDSTTVSQIRYSHSTNSMTFRTNSIDRVDIDSAGNVGIGASSPSGKLHVDQSSATGAAPVLYLDQADVSEEMIQFETTIGTGNAIEAVGAKTLTTTHFIKVTIPGGLTRYIPVGTIA